MPELDRVAHSQLLARLHEAKRVVAVTGAGISAESGVPTFRDAMTGLWSRFDPAELATPEAFQRNPKLVWDWYRWRHQKVLSANPNRGHLALAVMQQRFPEFLLGTQNVDDLHQRAGSDPVVQLHGSIMRVRCSQCGRTCDQWPESTSDSEVPGCAHCHALLRPDVVWFGEPLPADALATALDAATRADVLLSIGTSSVVYPAAGIALAARDAGATIVEINPDRTPLSIYAHSVLAGPAGEILPQLLAALDGQC